MQQRPEVRTQVETFDPVLAQDDLQEPGTSRRDPFEELAPAVKCQAEFNLVADAAPDGA
jgi:hypothetical protein